jgi:hypothetical protein
LKKALAIGDLGYIWDKFGISLGYMVSQSLFRNRKLPIASVAIASALKKALSNESCSILNVTVTFKIERNR